MVPSVLHHSDGATGRRPPAPGQTRTEEYQRLKKIRIVDLLEGKTAYVLAILGFVAIVVLFALIMSQTG